MDGRAGRGRGAGGAGWEPQRRLLLNFPGRWPDSVDGGIYSAGEVDMERDLHDADAGTAWDGT